MLSFLRGANPPRTNNASNNPVMYEGGTSSVLYHKPDDPYIMTHTLPPVDDSGPSIVQPPFHYHIHQSERFNVHSGSGLFFMGLSPKPFATLSRDKPHAFIPAGRYHRFENTSRTEPLVLDIELDPQNHEGEQSFFRNFFGYLDDCKKHKAAPSIFQLMVFLHAADTPLALPMPFGLETLGVYVSRVFLIVMASVGWLLGYKTSYPEYYQEKKNL